jgi:hypothetical protein
MMMMMMTMMMMLVAIMMLTIPKKTVGHPGNLMVWLVVQCRDQMSAS